MLDTSAERTEKIPIRVDAHGAVRVGGTQVTLDVLVDAYDQGATPEQIAQRFGELRLHDIYAVITYLLRHPDEVRAYLAGRSREAEGLRREAQTVSPNGAFRERLLRVKRDREGRTE